MKLLGKAISGTCGARTYSVGGAGVTARQKTCPVNKNSLAQARRRGLFAAAGAAFKSLTALQRAELHARALAASDTDIFGKKITLSDYAFFLREWMRGWRPSPSEDISISLLNWMREHTWSYMAALPVIVNLSIQEGEITSETAKGLNQTRNNFSIKYPNGETVSPIKVGRTNATTLGLQLQTPNNSTPTSITYTDILGRVFTF